MHRTQLMIEDWQYEALRARAEREGRSLSAVVREILQAALTPAARTRQDGIAKIEGIGEDRAANGEGHDRYLYGEHGEDDPGAKARRHKGKNH